MMIPKPKPVELAPFDAGAVAPAARYGLPPDVAFCKRCIISNQRPNSSVEFLNTADSPKTTIRMDEDGICDACRHAETWRVSTRRRSPATSMNSSNHTGTPTHSAPCEERLAITPASRRTANPLKACRAAPGAGTRVS